MASFKEQSEAAFVKFIFTRLQELLEVRLVSSEDFRWLPTAGSTQHDQKPDLIVAERRLHEEHQYSTQPFTLEKKQQKGHMFVEFLQADISLKNLN